MFGVTGTDCSSSWIKISHSSLVTFTKSTVSRGDQLLLFSGETNKFYFFLNYSLRLRLRWWLLTLLPRHWPSKRTSYIPPRQHKGIRLAKVPLKYARRYLVNYAPYFKSLFFSQHKRFLFSCLTVQQNCFEKLNRKWYLWFDPLHVAVIGS